MSTIAQDARRAAFNRCPETCGKVQQEIAWVIANTDLADTPASKIVDEVFAQALKHGTEPVRAALIDAEQELLQAERDRDDALAECESLKEQLANAEQQLADEIDSRSG